MKKVVFLLAVLVFALVFAVSCGDSSVTTDPTTEAEPIEKFESLKIADNSLDAYTIVYAESDLADEAAANPEFLPVWDFNRETAERLSDLIFEVSGIRLPIACDVDTVETKNEILIGKTNRGVTDGSGLSKLAVESYRICVSDTKLAICGGEYGSTWHAIDYIEQSLRDALASGIADYVFSADMLYNGKFDFIRIACIGDSITAGAVCDNASVNAFPAQIERWLWKDVITYNLGHSGRSMRDDLEKSYMKTTEYQQALVLSSDIDIFTIMLGTNDSNLDRNWTEADSDLYRSGCETLFRSLSQKNPDVQFLLINTPAVFGSRVGKHSTPKIRELQAELFGTMNEKGYKTSFFDMFTLTEDKRQYFSDDLHPDAAGHTFIGEALAKKLAEMIKDVK